MTLPEGYVNFGPWLAAHAKNCPGEKQPRVVARVVKRRAKSKPQGPRVAAETSNDPRLETQTFIAEVGQVLGKRVGQSAEKAATQFMLDALDNFFKGGVE